MPDRVPNNFEWRAVYNIYRLASQDSEGETPEQYHHRQALCAQVCELAGDAAFSDLLKVLVRLAIEPSPGPLMVEEINESVDKSRRTIAIIDVNGCNTIARVEGGDWPTRKANAQLFATAPVLLAKLERFVEQMLDLAGKVDDGIADAMYADIKAAREGIDQAKVIR